MASFIQRHEKETAYYLGIAGFENILKSDPIDGGDVKKQIGTMERYPSTEVEGQNK